MTKKIKPVTPGLRFRIPPSFEEITTNVPEKSLLIPLKKSGGRNGSGKMTVRNIGGGLKNIIRLVDFKRTKDDVEAIVKTIEYDPTRSAFIALVTYRMVKRVILLLQVVLRLGKKLFLVTHHL
mgnify:CR=1 FL=1